MIFSRIITTTNFVLGASALSFQVFGLYPLLDRKFELLKAEQKQTTKRLEGPILQELKVISETLQSEREARQSDKRKRWYTVQLSIIGSVHHFKLASATLEALLHEVVIPNCVIGARCNLCIRYIRIFAGWLAVTVLQVFTVHPFVIIINNRLLLHHSVCGATRISVSSLRRSSGAERDPNLSPQGRKFDLRVWITQRITGAREGGFRLLAVRRVPRLPSIPGIPEIVYEVGNAAVFLEFPMACLRYPIWGICIADTTTLAIYSLFQFGNATYPMVANPQINLTWSDFHTKSVNTCGNREDTRLVSINDPPVKHQNSVFRFSANPLRRS